MADEKRVPKIRFKGFDEEWERYNLSDISKAVTRTDSDSSSPIMMITAEHGFINQSERYSFDNSGDSLKKYILLKKNELAYNHGASKLRPYGSCFALQIDEARIPFVYHCFSVGENNPEFISTKLNSQGVANQLRKLVSSGARMDGLLNITFSDYGTISLYIPKIIEQNKIADLLLSLDSLIAQTESKYESLQRLKETMLEKLFPKDGADVPELRFKGFSGAWNKTVIHNICSISTGKSNTQDTVDGGIYPFYVRSPIIERSNRYLYDEEAVLTVGDGAIGKIFHYVNGKYDLHQRVYRLFDFKYVLAKYFYYYFSLKFYDRAMMMTAKTSVDSVRLETIANMPVLYPENIEEQNVIANYFQLLDKCIKQYVDKITSLTKIKKSLLEKMFV